MRYVATLSAALLFGFMVVAVPSFSQTDDHPQETRDKDKEKDKDKGNANGRPVDQDQTKRDERQARPEEKNPRHDDRDARQGENRQNNDDRRGHEEARPSGGYQGQQNGGYAQQQRPEQGRRQGHRIPDDRFRASFGREHHFHVDRARVYNQQQPVVVYGGYSFQLVEAWPVDWAYTDDCYIDYDDVDSQYYLYDAYHPGMRIAVFVIE